MEIPAARAVETGQAPPPQADVVPMLRACAVSLALMSAAWLGLTLATNVWVVILSTMVRSVGSATLWVYSTLMLQVRVPNALQGRMFALELAFCTVGAGCRRCRLELSVEMWPVHARGAVVMCRMSCLATAAELECNGSFSCC